MSEEFKVSLSSVYGELANPNTIKFRILENTITRDGRSFENFKEKYKEFLKENISNRQIESMIRELYQSTELTPSFSIRPSERKPIYLIPRGYIRSIRFDNYLKSKQETFIDEYRKIIGENKYGRITIRNRQISIPRIQCTESNGNNIKYAPRRFPNDMGK